MNEELNALIGSYLTANPNAENPMDYLYIFGDDALIELLTIAKNSLIEFVIDTDYIDGIDPYINGKLIKLN